MEFHIFSGNTSRSAPQSPYDKMNDIIPFPVTLSANYNLTIVQTLDDGQ